MKNLKKLLANKNVVTLLAGIFLVLVIYALYNWRIEQMTGQISIPIAKVMIPARTEITEDMISYVKIAPASIKGDVLTNVDRQIIGSYTNVNCVIPEGSFFYDSVIVEKEELPDSFLIDIGEGMVPYSHSVSIESTYGNSMYPGNYVDMYFKGVEGDKVLVGKLIENVKILAVKDSAGNHVFEGADSRTPSQIIFSVDQEMHRLLRSANYLKNVELILVPNSASYVVEDKETIVTAITSEYIKSYIEERSVSIDE